MAEAATEREASVLRRSIRGRSRGRPHGKDRHTSRHSVDASVHFTPEFYSNLDWEVRQTPEGNGEVYPNYFHRSQREIERQFIAVSAAHLTILEALDRCFDGRFRQTDACRERLGNFVRLGRAFNEAYERQYRGDDGN